MPLLTLKEIHDMNNNAFMEECTSTVSVACELVARNDDLTIGERTVAKNELDRLFKELYKRIDLLPFTKNA